MTVGSDLSHRPLTTLDESLITSSTSLFALIASPFTGIFADKYGRRRVILVADALFAIGTLVQTFTSHVWIMIIGRSIVGLAVGSASAITPLYATYRNLKEIGTNVSVKVYCGDSALACSRSIGHHTKLIDYRRPGRCVHCWVAVLSN